MTCLIDRKNGIPADNLTLAYQRPSHQLLCPHLARRLRIQSQLPRLQKTAVFHSHWPLSILFCNPTSFFILDFPRVFNGARFIVHPKNPEACRLPVRPFQTSAKLFPLEDSLSGPMTLLALIPPLCKILFPQWNDRYSTTAQVPSLEQIFLHRHQSVLILIAILISSALLKPILIKSKVRLRLWARCLCCPSLLPFVFPRAVWLITSADHLITV